jgi:opacity protein-like surface antigen
MSSRKEDVMLSRRRLYTWISVITLGVPSMALGQPEESFHHLTISLGAGLTTIAGTIAGTLDHGGNVQMNGGYFLNRHFGITGNFMWSNLGITRAALDSVNEPDGKANVYAVTADPTVRWPLGHGFTAYALGGAGYLRQNVTFTMPVVVDTYQHIFHTFRHSYHEPSARDIVLATIVSNSGGFDVGGGINMPWPGMTVKVFVEARYFKGFTSNADTSVVPITFGIRW